VANSEIWGTPTLGEATDPAGAPEIGRASMRRLPGGEDAG
jgi:hypothetical protein